MSLSRRSGTLQLTTPRESGEIVFEGGKVVAAFRTGTAQSVGEALLGAQVITASVYQEMLAAQTTGKAGPALLEGFEVSREAVGEALEEQLKNTIYDMFGWDEGTFSFVLEERPDRWRGFALDGTRSVSEGGLNPQYLAIEGARIRDEKTREDSLESFLSRDKPPPAPAEPAGNLKNARAFADELRQNPQLAKLVSPEQSPGGAAALPAPAATPLPLPPSETSDDDKVIPFPGRKAASAAEPLPVPHTASTTPPTPAAAVAGSAAGVCLVVVDDDPQLLQHVEKHFDAGELVLCASVEEALAVVEKHPPESLVVATDLIIARSDGRGILGGVQVLEYVRKRSQTTPVAIFTDYQNEEAEQRAKELGVQAVISKPRKAQIAADPQSMTGFVKALLELLGPHLEAAKARLAARPPAPADALEPASAPSLQQPTAPVAPSGDFMGDIAREFGGEHEASGLDLPPAVVSAGEMGNLRSMLAELIDPSNRDTVTLLVLRFASNVVERAGLYLATRRAYVGLGGFSQDEASDAFVGRVRKIQVPVESESIFAAVSKYRAMIRGPLADTPGNRQLIAGLGGDWPKGATVAAPLISGERVAAVLYGDNPSGRPLGATDTLEIFLQQAGLAMDRALLERKLEESRKGRGTKGT